MTEPRISDERVDLFVRLAEEHELPGGREIEDAFFDLRDCRAALANVTEYLADVCNAYEAWKAAKDNPEDEDGTNPEHVAWNALTDALDAACEGRQEP